MSVGRGLLTAGVMCGGAAVGYVGLVGGAVSFDLGVGRWARPLGPQSVVIDAPREVVFDVIAEPYLGRTTRALSNKVRVLERGADMVLAEHFTPVHGRLVAKTVETVRFTRPARVDFRLVKGPVPHVVEEFVLTGLGEGTRVDYRGEMAADLWGVGQWWSDLVARRWEQAVAGSLASIGSEAVRRAHPHRSRS